MPLGRALAALALVLSALPPPVFSYSCSGPPICAPPGADDVIFVGEVIREGREAQSADEPARPALFRVTDRFHGLGADLREVEVWSQYYESFALGSRWVIDAIRRSAESPRLETRNCGRTGRLDEPDRSLRKYSQRFLDHLEARRSGAAPTTARIAAYANRLSGIESVGPVELRLTGARTYDFSLPDNGRVFEGDIESGEYRMKVLAADFPHVGPDTFSATPGACGWLALQLGPNTRIAGQVTTAEGAPVDRAQVFIRQLVTDGEELLQTGPDGRYEILGVAPGRYGVEARKRGFRSVSLASPLVLEADALLDDLDIVLAGPLRVADVTLSIVGVDGDPVRSTPVSVSTRPATPSSSA